MEQCKLCNSFLKRYTGQSFNLCGISLDDGHEYIDIETQIEQYQDRYCLTTSLYRSPYSDDDIFCDSVEIKFCPFCGKELK